MTKFSRQNLSGAKLTGEMVLWGREQYELHLQRRGQGMNMRQIAEVQMVSRETVARYIRGETWKELGLGAGEHEQARESAIERMSAATAPANDSPEILASLARLQTLMGNPDKEDSQDSQAKEEQKK